MKQIFKTTFFLLLALLLPATASAFRFEANGIYYNTNGYYVTVTDADGNANTHDYTGDVVIPETVTYGSTTYSVTAIDGYAFYYCNGLTSVTIPNSVTSIGSYAFYYCSKLISIDIPNSVTSIKERTFSGCSSLTSITIPNSVTSIGYYAFQGCSGLTSVTIGSSVSSIGDYAFSDCSGITDLIWNARNCSYNGSMNTSNIERVTIGNEVEVLPYSFVSGSKISSVIIPNSVTSIGNEAFYNCDSLTNVTIGDSVSSIGYSAFYSCDGLTSVTIGNSVTYIDSGAFSDCIGITDLVWNARNCSSNGNMSTSNVERVTIGDEVEVLPENFVSGSKISTVIIPNSVTTIGYYAFNDCDSLTNVTIGNSVSSIGSYAFAYCNGLTSITIGNSVSSIDNDAFYGCNGLTCVNITDLDAWCCISFANYSSNPLYYAQHLFLNGEEIKNLVIPSSVTTIGNMTFYGCSGLTSVIIPNSVTSIGSYAFRNCSGLTSVNIPNSVTSIDYGAFYNCSQLSNVTIGKSVTTIGDYAFYYCSNLRKLVFNAVNCTSIGYRAFYSSNSSNNYIWAILQFGDSVEHIPAGLPSLNNGKTLIIPNSVKTIDAGAIRGSCNAVVIGKGIENIAAGTFTSSISNVYVSTMEPQPCEPGAFYYPQTLYVPAGSKSKYFTATGWSEFTYIIEGEYAVADSIMLDNTDVVLPKDATFQLNATILPDTATTTTASWISLNTNVASVNSNGLVTARGVGETDIMVWVDNVATTCHVTVTPIMVENITLNENHLSMAISDTYTLTVTEVSPNNAENKELEWDIPENDVIATLLVNNSRLNISAVNEGRVTITVRATDGSGRIATCEVFVSSTTPVKTLTITPETLDLHVGYSQQLTATITPEDAHTKTLQWMTSNSNVATVNSNGVVTAYGVGTATITAITTDGSNLSATCAVSVTTVPVESVTLNRTELEMNEGSSYTLSATVLPSDAYDRSLTWTSSNPRVATVNYNGRVTAVGIGSTIVTATTNDGSNISAACHVTVKSQMANDCFVIPDTEVLYGESVVIPVRLNNVRSFMAFQTDIFLPQGFKVAKDDNGKYIVTPSSRMTSDHVIMTQDVSNGAVRVICYTPMGSSFTGGSGTDLFYITVTAPEDAGGDYSINLRNSRLTTANYTEVTIPDAGAVLKVKTFIPGDVNNSRTVTVTDIVVTAQYILENNPNPFVFEAADMNGDGIITVTDIMLIVQKIMNPSMYNAPRRMSALMTVDDRMSGEDISLMDGETRTVTIALDNTLDYSAFQLDLTLPDGLTASNFTLTDRAGSHLLNVNTLGNGDIRALCYSSTIEMIDGHSGALLTFDVNATEAVEGLITVDGIELVTTDCQTVMLDGFAIGVHGATSVNELNSGKEVARVDYFNLAGQRINRPDSGVTIVVTTYTDGTRSTTKLFQ